MILINDCQEDFKGVCKELEKDIDKRFDEDSLTAEGVADEACSNISKCVTIKKGEAQEVLKILVGILIDKGMAFKVEEEY